LHEIRFHGGPRTSHPPKTLGYQDFLDSQLHAVSRRADPALDMSFPGHAACAVAGHGPDRNRGVPLRKSESNRITRYDISAGASKPWVDLPEGHPQMTAACADENGLLVAYGSSVYRYDLAGGNESLVFQAASSVQHILVDGNLVFISEWRWSGWAIGHRS
jgi:hypothetical protein